MTDIAAPTLTSTGSSLTCGATVPTLARSTIMYTLHEALAREHQRHLETEARHRMLRRRLASAHRWRTLERRAHTAHLRLARRAERAAEAAAVAR